MPGLRNRDTGQKIIEQLAETFAQKELQTFVSLTEKLQAQTYKVIVPAKAIKRASNPYKKSSKS